MRVVDNCSAHRLLYGMTCTMEELKTMLTRDKAHMHGTTATSHLNIALLRLPQYASVVGRGGNRSSWLSLLTGCSQPVITKGEFPEQFEQGLRGAEYHFSTHFVQLQTVRWVQGPISVDPVVPSSLPPPPFSSPCSSFSSGLSLLLLLVLFLISSPVSDQCSHHGCMWKPT
jgi:hypothetical protein